MSPLVILLPFALSVAAAVFIQLNGRRQRKQMTRKHVARVEWMIAKDAENRRQMRLPPRDYGLERAEVKQTALDQLTEAEYSQALNEIQVEIRTALGEES